MSSDTAQPGQWNDEEQGYWDDEEPGMGEWGFRSDVSTPTWSQTWTYLKDQIRTSWSSPTAWLLTLLLEIPLAWVSHFIQWHHNVTFGLCFIAMVPLQKIFDWGGEELGAYLKQDLKDLVVITLSNAIEAALALILLVKCQLRLLQSTIIGVVLLHLLLVPGAAFCAGGAQMHEQRLDPNHNSLNHSLSMIGVLGILVPTIFFAALDRGDVTDPSAGAGLPPAFVPLVSDSVRRYILQTSRGIAIILPVVYVVSRLWRHRVIPGDLPLRDSAHQNSPTSNATSGLMTHSAPPIPTSAEEDQTPILVYSTSPPDDAMTSQANVHLGFCLLAIITAVGLMIPTAEFLVSSIEDVRESSGIQTEWFGLILLPILSFSGDGIVVIYKYSHQRYRQLRKYVKMRRSNKKSPKDSPAAARWKPINLGIRVKDKSSSSAGFWVALPTDTTSPKQAEAVRWWPIDLSIQWEGPPTLERTSGTAKEPEDKDDIVELAHWRPIDLSIQFMLWWTPFLVLLGWWTDRPMHLLFDYFEVGLLVGACFLVNYVTVDGKTNFSEGFTMIAFYVIIATATWFYPGQPQVGFMLNCPGTVAEAVAMGTERMHR